MQRHSITVRGIVQGVGFRPFVYRLASRLRLNGFVKNRAGFVLIEVEGSHGVLDQFFKELQTHPPSLSRIDEVSRRTLPLLGDRRFLIEPSDAESSSTVFVSADVATCPDCFAELFDPADRRYRYPFLNCTNCGPRLTIIRGVPYDRQRTTMSSFSMCRPCRAEYDDPVDRRFHAQPTACPVCGPHLFVADRNGQRIDSNDPFTFLAKCLRAGQIAAVKGLGGYHLVCDAGNAHVVHELRRRKHRDEKPFAVMVRDVDAARTVCELCQHERELLESQRRPIVLLRKRPSRDGLPTSRAVGQAGREVTDLDRSPSRSLDALAEREGHVCETVAPDNPYLGVMLPYTPLHHLLMESVETIPLVMTSGNRSDEPIAYRDDEAIDRLGEIADVFLIHDRAIRVRCDDSVTRVVDGEELPVRRSRGYAPEPIKLPRASPCPILAVGGQLKGVFALARDHQAFLSHHLGDLDHFDAYRAFEKDILLYEQLFDIRPKVIVHDLHPDYTSTGYAQRRAAQEGLELLAVQHHHAHVASCMAEHGLDGPVIGVSFDGTGFGTDEAIWGGEFFVGDCSRFSRVAHLRYVRMPGGDRAIREPWRMAVAYLRDAGCDQLHVTGVSSGQRRTAEQMIARGFHAPFTSSVGRLFDAAAAVAGVRTRVSYEGQAAAHFEALASDVPENGAYPFDLLRQPPNPDDRTASPNRRMIVDTRPLMRALADDVRKRADAELVARRFHSTMVEIIAAVCGSIRAETQLGTVVLSGGVFLNALLTRETSTRLRSEGFRVYRHRLVPPGDGGLSLGQLAIAANTCAAAGASRFEPSLSSSACPT